MLKKTGRNDPCICGSGIKFKRCCAKDTPTAEIFSTNCISVTGEDCHHFFVSNASFSETIKDDKGCTLIWDTREAATSFAWRDQSFMPFAVVGMGDEKWTLFQAEEKFILMEEEN